MAKQPAFGRGVRPELMLADFSPIVAGGQAMGAGIASAGQSVGNALQERGEMNKEVSAAKARAKALGAIPDMPDNIRASIDSVSQQLDDPDLTLRQRAGIAQGANSMLRDTINIGTAALQEREFKIFEETEARKRAEEEERLLGEATTRANRADAYSGALRADLAQPNGSDPYRRGALGLFEQGDVQGGTAMLKMAPERSVPEPEIEFITDDVSGERFAVHGKSMQQIRKDRNTVSMTPLEREFEAINRARFEQGLDPLPAEDRERAAREYVKRRINGSAEGSSLLKALGMIRGVEVDSRGGFRFSDEQEEGDSGVTKGSPYSREELVEGF